MKKHAQVLGGIGLVLVLLVALYWVTFCTGYSKDSFCALNIFVAAYFLSLLYGIFLLGFGASYVLLKVSRKPLWFAYGVGILAVLVGIKILILR